MGGGASGAGEGYVPSPEFVEDAKEALVDLNTSDSTELWLVQWPHHMPVDFDGQELTLKLHRDGKLGTLRVHLECDVVSFAAQDPDATIFTSSSSGPRIVGKISRRVSLVHYQDPNELKRFASDNLSPLYQRPSGTSVTNASRQFSSVSPNSKLSCWQKSGISDAGETSKPYKRRHPHDSTDSLGLGNSAQDSGRGHSSAVTAEFSKHS